MSIIKQDIAQQLQLNDKDVTVTLTKVDGDRNLFQTNNAEIQQIKAIGLPSISEDITELNLERISNPFDIDLAQLNAEVMICLPLAIGIDYLTYMLGNRGQMV